MTVANLPAQTTSRALAVQPTVIDGELVTTPTRDDLPGTLALVAYTGALLAGSAALAGLPVVAAGAGLGAVTLAGVSIRAKNRTSKT